MGTFEMSGDGRSRTYTTKNPLENQGAIPAEKAEIEPSSWHFGGSDCAHDLHCECWPCRLAWIRVQRAARTAR